MVSHKYQIKCIGKHRFMSTFLILAILSTHVCYSQAGARPKTTQRALTDQDIINANNRAVSTLFQKQPDQKFINREEKVFKRHEPATNIKHLLEEMKGTELNLQHKNRPAISTFKQLEGLFLETRSQHTLRPVSSKISNYADTEEVILPIKKTRREMIYVSVDGKAMFTTPYSTPYEIDGKERLFRESVTFYEDDKNNTYVFLPLKKSGEDIYGRFQFWVKTSKRFADKVTKEHLFQKYGYYQIPSTHVPEWLRLKSILDTTVKNVQQSVVSSEPSTSDGFVLDLFWTPADCAANIGYQFWVDKDICDGEGKWVIHGLFNIQKDPNYDYRKMICYYEILNETRTYINFGEWLDQTLINQLKIWWPIIRVEMTTEQWWEIEWCVHGKQLFDNSEEYFKTALDLLDKSRINEPFLPEEPAYPDNDRIVSLSGILGSIERRVTKEVDLYCYATSDYYAVVSQVKICFNNMMEGINCKKSHIQYCNVNYRFSDYRRRIMGIHHFPRYKIISHLILTLVLEQTQMRRLLNPIKNNENRYWKIHKLCPSMQMDHIINRYKKERVHSNFNSLGILNSYEKFHQDKKNISFIWPTLEYGTYHDRLWSKQWISCGFYLNNLNDQRFLDSWHYVDTTVSLFNELKSNQWRFPTGTYSRDDFHQRLHQQSRLVMGLEIPPYSVILVCTKINGKTHLVKMRLCYSVDLQFIQCPPSEVEFVRGIIDYINPPKPYVDCGNQFILNENYESQ